MTKPYLPVFMTILQIVLFSCKSTPIATLVLTNGKIATVNEEFEFVESIACDNDRIIFTGNNSEVARYIGSTTKVIDLKGKLVLPGLIDTQGHMLELGSQLTYLNVSNAKSYEELISIVKKRVDESKPGEWILGGRWDQNNWDNTDFPTHELLSSISPNNPVFLDRVDGYAALVNNNAMQLANIDSETPTPFGGSIIKDKNNHPTGVLINRAMNLVKSLIPVETDSSYKEKIKRAVDNCIKVGLTSWNEIGASPYEISLYKDLIDDNNLKMRTVIFLGKKENPLIEGDLEKYFLQYKLEDYGNNFLSVRGIQLHFDGSIGSRGAALFEPYDDDPQNVGLLRIPPEYVYRVAQAALNINMILNTSCIGTRGNNLCLENYQKVLEEHPGKDHRLRITHAQILLPADIPRFAELGVIASMQPIHATSDKRFVEKRLGKSRMKGAYAWRSLLDAGTIISCGSDFPVETNNPFKGIYAAITRMDESGNPPGGWYPEQCMTIQEVVKGYTIWAAYSTFQENILGSIEEGKLADFTIIDRDIFSIEQEQILETKVLYTIIGGNIVYSSDEE